MTFSGFINTDFDFSKLKLFYKLGFFSFALRFSFFDFISLIIFCNERESFLASILLDMGDNSLGTATWIQKLY